MRTLLLADDSITIQRVIALTFAEEAFKVITVSDGQQAIDRMAAQKPDIVLAGTTMSNVNGYELAKYVRSQPALDQVPVLLLTGAFEAPDEGKLEACGASGTLEKPFEPSIVINRVKELLGMKGDAGPSPTAAAGRRITPPAPKEDKPKDEKAKDDKPKLQAVAPPATESAPIAKPKSEPASWDELRQETGLAGARSVESGGGGEGFDDLDAAFDSLDRQLRRPGAAPPAEAQGRKSADPRSPGRAPAESPAGSPNPVFEVDDEWFAEGNKTREQQRAEQNQLAAEMGIHDVELPDAPPAIGAAAPADTLDFDFGLDDRPPAAAEPKRIASSAPRSPFAAPLGATPAATTPSPAAPAGPKPVPAAAAPAAPLPLVVPPPEITEAMLEQIAERVAAKLGASVTDSLQKSVADAIRDTVRSVVSETSERLVRDEIARIKSKS